MKVTNNQINNAINSGKTDAASGLKKDNPANQSLMDKTGLQGAANVNLSERAQLMQKAKELASSPTQVDEARVARFQKLIDDGKYKVDAESIADRLVDEHLSSQD